ncbi:Protein mlo2 [Bienertia sinuspersici]
MERTCADRHKDDQNEGDQFYNYNKIQGSADQSALYTSESKAQTLAKVRICENWFQELFLRRNGGIGVQIPKQLVSLDEKYFKRCLELMHVNGWKGAPCALSVNLGSLDSGFVSDYSTVGRRSSLDIANHAIDYPMAVGNGDEDIIGSIMGSNSMMRILKSPLFQRLGISDHDANLGLTHKPENESVSPRNQGYASDSVERSPISTSTGVSVLTDQSSASSLSPVCSQGMLHLTWDSGNPHFTFTLDDQKEVYVANACKIEVKNVKALDYVYTFHLKTTGSKLFDVADNELETIGKMKVSTAFSLSPSNTRIMETEFVLVGANDHHARETHTLSRNSRRSRKLSKVMEVFKSGHSFKQRTPSLFGGSSTIPEDFIPEKGSETYCNSYQECKTDYSENEFIPNLELAAVVVKNHLKDEHFQKKEVGGWGLNFLKKSGKQRVASAEVSASSECCLRSVGDCSTSMDIIVPAGPHGGPRTRNGGPNGLVERWRSGGKCDCGGWDMGCPLKILKAKPRREEDRPVSETQGECKSFDICIEGSTRGTPPLKMVNIRDGLYFISFQPSFLSPLQCLSIASSSCSFPKPEFAPKTCTGLMS